MGRCAPRRSMTASSPCRPTSRKSPCARAICARQAGHGAAQEALVGACMVPTSSWLMPSAHATCATGGGGPLVCSTAELLLASRSALVRAPHARTLTRPDPCHKTAVESPYLLGGKQVLPGTPHEQHWMPCVRAVSTANEVTLQVTGFSLHKPASATPSNREPGWKAKGFGARRACKMSTWHG